MFLAHFMENANRVQMKVPQRTRLLVATPTNEKKCTLSQKCTSSQHCTFPVQDPEMEYQICELRLTFTSFEIRDF